MVKHTFTYEAYQGRHRVYMLDAPEQLPDGDMQIFSAQYQKHKNFRRVCQKYTPYDVVNVTFPRGTRPEGVERYFKDEFKQYGKDDQIVVYFCGLASGNGEDYIWQFNGYPKKPIDAYELIRIFHNVKCDIVLLLDAYIPERFWDKWEAKENTVEIIARGEVAEIAEGRKASNDPGDFSFQMVMTLDKFFKQINHYCEKCGTPTTDQKPSKFVCMKPGCDGAGKEDFVKQAFGGYFKPLSLHRLIISNDSFKKDSPEMSAKLRRVEALGDKRKKLFVLHPDDLRETKKIKFWCKNKVEIKEEVVVPGENEEDGVEVETKAAAEEEEIDQPEGTVFDDEGVADMTDAEQAQGTGDGQGLSC